MARAWLWLTTQFADLHLRCRWDWRIAWTSQWQRSFNCILSLCEGPMGDSGTCLWVFTLGFVVGYHLWNITPIIGRRRSCMWSDILAVVTVRERSLPTYICNIDDCFFFAIRWRSTNCWWNQGTGHWTKAGLIFSSFLYTWNVYEYLGVWTRKKSMSTFLR